MKRDEPALPLPRTHTAEMLACARKAGCGTPRRPGRDRADARGGRPGALRCSRGRGRCVARTSNRLSKDRHHGHQDGVTTRTQKAEPEACGAGGRRCVQLAGPPRRGGVNCE